MDLDRALTFLVVATAFVSGAAALKMRAWRWLGVQLANLAVVGAAWLFARAWVAEIVGPTWLLTVIAPSLSTTWSDRFTRAERFGVAHALARVAATLHPTPVTRMRVLVAGAQRAEQAGRRDEQAAYVARLRATPSGETLAHLFTLRIDQRWAETRAWLEERPGTLGADPVALSFYLRALGELGDLDALAATFAIATKTPAYAALEGQALLFLTAFGGREAALASVLAAYHAEMPEDGKELWRLTAARAAGKDVREGLVAIAESGKPRLAAVARLRLGSTVGAAPPSEAARRVLDEAEALAAKLEPARAPRPSAALTLAAINLYVFAREIPGGTTRAANLFALGALYTEGLDARESYRFATATLLHYGALHLAMNMLALVVLGRALEAVIGRARFVAVYVVAGVAANVLHVLWATSLHKTPQTVVGASGCVMGVAGALLVRRIVRWRVRRTPLARGEVVSLASLLVLQTAFDAVTPEVAGAVHLFGAAVGALLAIVLGRPRGPLPAPASAPSSASDPARASVLRGRVVALAIAGAVVATLEVVWAHTPAFGDMEACHAGDASACERDCVALLGPDVARGGGTFGADDAGVHALVPRVSGARRRWLVASCNALASDLYAPDGGVADEARARAIFAATCDAGSAHGCTAEGEVAEYLDLRACTGGDTDACERNCERVYGRGAFGGGVGGGGGNDGGDGDRDGRGASHATSPGPPRVKGARRDSLVSSCARLAYALSTKPDAGAADERRAYAIYATTCDAGNVVACTNEGVMLENGEGVAADRDAAMRVFADVCAAGHARACTYWGEGLLGDAGALDAPAARAALEHACDAGDDRGCDSLRRLLPRFRLAP